MFVPFFRRARPWLRALAALFTLLAAALPALAGTYFIAPPSQPPIAGADGSRDRPWASLTAAFASGTVLAGDDLRLLAGAYGTQTIDKAVFTAPVTISPANGARVHMTGLSVLRSRNLIIEGLHIWPTEPSKGHLVQTDGRSAAIIFRGLDIRGREDAETYPTWTQADWTGWKRTGILLQGPDSAIFDSRFTGVSFGIGTTGARARVEGNVIRGFSGDGIRGLGDASVFLRNRIEDCVQVDNNHADGFQSWSRGPKGDSGKGVVHGLRIEANIIREWAHPTVSALRCSLQGIGMFDGMYEDVIIRNNLVEVSAPHGITVGGGRRVEITHNTVINNRAFHPKYPWIRVPPHKNGTPSEDALIANNIATVLQYARKPQFRISASGNLLQTPPIRIFVDPAKGDFRPRPGGPADGRGDPAHRLSTDLFGKPRAAQPDIGAIEHR